MKTQNKTTPASVEGARNVENRDKCKVRCIYVDGKPQMIILLLLSETLTRMVITDGCKVYTFAFKEEAWEFLREKLKMKNFEIGPCPTL
jgi:hypothetical protein